MDPDFDCKSLMQGGRTMGATGTDIAYLIHNVHLFLFNVKKKRIHYIQHFDEMTVLPRRYYGNPRRLLSIRSLLGMEVIILK